MAASILFICRFRLVGLFLDFMWTRGNCSVLLSVIVDRLSCVSQNCCLSMFLGRLGVKRDSCRFGG